MTNHKEQQAENFHSLTVYDRLHYKMHGEINELDTQERNVLEDMLLDHYAQRITKVSDEILLQIAADEGVLL